MEVSYGSHTAERAVFCGSGLIARTSSLGRIRFPLPVRQFLTLVREGAGFGPWNPVPPRFGGDDCFSKRSERAWRRWRGAKRRCLGVGYLHQSWDSSREGSPLSQPAPHPWVRRCAKAGDTSIILSWAKVKARVPVRVVAGAQNVPRSAATGRILRLNPMTPRTAMSACPPRTHVCLSSDQQRRI